MIPISDSEKSRRFPFFNLLFIGINIFVFFLQLTSPDPEAFINNYALIPAHVNPAIPSTLIHFITAMFLHGGFLHIASNMLFLWVFGDNVEGDLPFLTYPILYLGAGIAGNALQYAIDPHSTIPMLGASGAVAGALGGYFYLFPHHKVRSLLMIPPFITMVNISAKFMLGYWMVLQVISGIGIFAITSEQNVAYFAHIGGFLAVYLFVKIFPKRDPELVRIA